VVGYGLDYDDLYRNLPYVGTLRRDVLAREAAS
jgi:hypoxanthine-guanine phosphoribosyltransferase